MFWGDIILVTIPETLLKVLLYSSKCLVWMINSIVNKFSISLFSSPSSYLHAEPGRHVLLDFVCTNCIHITDLHFWHLSFYFYLSTFNTPTDLTCYCPRSPGSAFGLRANSTLPGTTTHMHATAVSSMIYLSRVKSI